MDPATAIYRHGIFTLLLNCSESKVDFFQYVNTVSLPMSLSALSSRLSSSNTNTPRCYGQFFGKRFYSKDIPISSSDYFLTTNPG